MKLNRPIPNEGNKSLRVIDIDVRLTVAVPCHFHAVHM